MNDDGKIYYSMDEVAQSIKCTRQEALEFVRANRLATIRRCGDTYLPEDELVRYHREHHRRTK